MSDIRVSVGAGYCNITSLATNRLICKPPLSHPGHGGVEGPDDAVIVEVCVMKCISHYTVMLPNSSTLYGHITQHSIL